MTPGALGALTVVLLVVMVLGRAALMRRRGLVAMRFGELDKSDYLIPPFAFFYFYSIFAAAFGWPSLGVREPVASLWISWLGVLFCTLGLGLILLSLVSFGKSFRIGIDTDRPGDLVTSGVFAFSRNPMYVAFAAVLLGEFLIAPSRLFLLYLVAGVALFHRQVLREEACLEEHYGREYRAYRERVRRYL